MNKETVKWVLELCNQEGYTPSEVEQQYKVEVLGC